MAAVTSAIEDALQTARYRERWKYSKPSRALALIEAAPTSSLVSNTSPDLVSLGDAIGMDTLLAEYPEALAGFGADQPIEVIEVTPSSTSELTVSPDERCRPLLIRVGRDATLSLRVTTSAKPAAASHIWLSLSEGARATCVRNLLEGEEQWHLFRAHLDRDAHLTLATHSTGSAFHRQDTRIVLGGPGAELEMTAATVCPPETHLDAQVVVEHRSGQSRSQQRVHVVAQQDAEATFGGRIHIHEHCAGSDAELSNRNLVLSPSAVINAKPELEIYTDDVKCAHGATIGRLDDDQSFYCEARGIDAITARKLLSFAFLRSAMTEEADALAAFERLLQ